MTVALSILIPHKPTPNNDKALALALQSIFAETEYAFELFINTEVPGDPYAIWNEYAKIAKGRILVFSNSDVIFAPGWMKGFLAHTEPNTIVTNHLVEPGNIGVASVNIHKNFGKTPDEFDFKAFKTYAAEHMVADIKEERAWYMPCAMEREWFCSTGGFPTYTAFPHPNDIIFWDYCRDVLGTKFLRVGTHAYHFQCQSSR